MKTYYILIILIITNDSLFSQNQNDSYFLSCITKCNYNFTKFDTKKYTTSDYQFKTDLGFFISHKNAIGFGLGFERLNEKYLITTVLSINALHRYYFIKNEDADLFLHTSIGLRLGKVTELIDQGNEKHGLTGFAFGTNLGFAYPITKKIGLELQVGAIDVSYDPGVIWQYTLRQNISFFNSVSIGIRIK
jgi:hypothetical protein